MEYQFECDNMHPGCTGLAEGKTHEEVLAAAAEHAREAHGMETLSEDAIAMVRQSITER